MDLATTLVQALVGAAVAVLIWEVIGGWGGFTRATLGKWLALSLILWIALSGPFTLG